MVRATSASRDEHLHGSAQGECGVEDRWVAGRRVDGEGPQSQRDAEPTGEPHAGGRGDVQARQQHQPAQGHGARVEHPPQCPDGQGQHEQGWDQSSGELRGRPPGEEEQRRRAAHERRDRDGERPLCHLVPAGGTPPEAGNRPYRDHSQGGRCGADADGHQVGDPGGRPLASPLVPPVSSPADRCLRRAAGDVAPPAVGSRHDSRLEEQGDRSHGTRRRGRALQEAEAEGHGEYRRGGQEKRARPGRRDPTPRHHEPVRSDDRQQPDLRQPTGRAGDQGEDDREREHQRREAPQDPEARPLLLGRGGGR